MRHLLIALLVLLLSIPVAAQQSPDSPPAYTYHQSSGNRFVSGQGTFPNVDPHDFALDAVPVWLTGLAIGDAQPVWNIAYENGDWQAVIVFPEGGQDSTEVVSAALPPGAPFLSTVETRAWNFINGLDARSDLTHPVLLDGGLVYINTAGDLIFWNNNQPLSTVSLQALPDARIVSSSAGQIAVYGGADDQRYTHGVLGDSIEATNLSVLAISDDQLQTVTTISLPEPDVFEGLSPIWADVDGDGTDDLIATVSNAQVGAQIRVYRVDGTLLAASDPIGQGQRWRHQLAYGPFGPNGESEIVDVRTPHLGGIVEFFQLQGDRLEIAASLPGYTSHVLGTRNLDMAVAGDFNGDGQPEIVLPVQDRSALAGLQHGPDGVVEVWRLPLDGTLVTNLSAITLPDQSLALAAGTQDKRLRVWVSTGG